MSDRHHRNVRPLAEPDEPVQRGRNVIAVIGIDQYQHLQTLHNAVSDAKGVRSLFIDHLGFQELLPPLYNEQATRGAITSLVIDQLGSKLEPEDNLVFFFAGHGYTETRTVGTRTRQTGYLIPVEGSPPEERKFSTYLRLDAFLEEIAGLPALHILVILDACYSGFALGESVRVLRDVQRYSDDLSKRMSRRVIASAMSDQPALDNGPVTGHSLFTGTLVEALAHGKADAERKGFVTSSEIALYVQKQVASWSGSQQTPDFGSFELDDRGELVISLLGETQSRQLAQESLQIADYVLALGWHTGDPKRFTAAATQYRDALRHALLGKSALPAAELGLGRALLAAGETDEAIKILTELVEGTEEATSGKAHFYLGLAHAKRRNYDDAAKLLHAWQKANPQHEDASWINAYVEWLNLATSSPNDSDDPYLFAFDFSQRRGWSETSLSKITSMYNRFQASINAPFPRATEAFGRAFYEKGEYSQAITLLQQVLAQSQDIPIPVLQALAFAQIRAGDYKAARHTLAQFTHQAPAPDRQAVAQIMEQLEGLFKNLPDGSQPLPDEQQIAALLQSIRQLEQQPLREIAGFLQEVIDKREARDDLWPEGRLQLGITYALLEEYANAARVLDEVIQICRSGGRYMEEQFSAA